MKKNEQLEKQLLKKPRDRIVEERYDLMDRQKVLRKRKEEIEDQYRLKIDALLLSDKADDDGSKALLRDQIRILRDQIDDVNKEYKENAESIVSYSNAIESGSKEQKNNDEGKSSLISAIGTVLIGAAGTVLGGVALSKSYESDTEGTMRNNKVHEFFMRFNPAKWLFKK